MNGVETRAPGTAVQAVDLVALASAARGAEGGEAYQEISRDAAHRTGVVASVYPSGCVYYTLECTFRLFQTDGAVVPSHLASAARTARVLQAAGYELAHLDAGWISCEKVVLPTEFLAEAEFLRRCLLDDDEVTVDSRPSDAATP